MSRTDGRSDEPRAVIHRRILDLADDMPEASLEKIANGVSGASPELVEKVLTEYGDPSNEPSDGPGDEDDTEADPTESADTGDANADLPTGTGGSQDATELSEKQRETLGLIARNPDATQRELAAELGVTAATISRWVNDVTGFDWSDREAFVAGVLDDRVDDTAGPDGDEGDTTGSDGTRNDSPGSDAGDPGDPPASTAGGSDPTSGDVLDEMDGNAENGRTGSNVDRAIEITDLRRRVAALEDRLEGESGDAATGEVGGERDDVGPDRIDTELLHKVVHACIASERTTEEEEIRLLDHLLG